LGFMFFMMSSDFVIPGRRSEAQAEPGIHASRRAPSW
jgi:hypothetical protein